MSFSTEINKSVSSFRVLLDIDSKDGNYAGRFSFDEFIPIGSADLYQGRLKNDPRISIKRDSAFFGILVFGASSIQLINNDGAFDTLMDDYNVIGSSIKVYIGYVELDISEYVNIYTGYIEKIEIKEDVAIFGIADLRKRLTTGSSVDLEFVDAVQGVENILLGNYAITAGSLYFDVSAMTAAKALAYDVYRKHPDNDTVNKAIEDCVKSTMGFFFITGDGRYSYKMIDTDATSVSVISRYDVINPTAISYDEKDILGSTSVESPPFPLIEAGTITTESKGQLYPIAMDNGSLIFVEYVPLSGGMNIRKTSDYCSSFSVMEISSTSSVVRNIISPKNGEILICCSDRIFRSKDYGSSWSIFTTVLPLTQAINEGSGVVLYYGMNSSSAFSVMRSTDYGSSWSAYTTVSSYLFEYAEWVVGTGVYVLARESGTADYGTSMTIFTSSIGSVYATAAVFSGFAAFDVTGICHISTGDLFVAFRASDGLTFSGQVTNSQILKLDSTGIDVISVYERTDITGINASFIYNMIVDENDMLYMLENTSGGFGNSAMKSINAPDENGVSGFEYIGPSKLSRTLFYDPYQGNIFVGKTYTATEEKLYIGKYSDNMNWALNNTYKASTYSSYGIDTLKHFNTKLIFNSDAVLLAEDLIVYFKDLHGELSITVPMKYYAVNVGDNVDVQIWRETTSFLGTKKCEVLGKEYDLKNAMIKFNLRII